jgi:hypothetical protein
VIPSASALTALIRDHRKSFLAENKVESYYRVNCGLCEEFACEVQRRFSEPDRLDVRYTEEFFDDQDDLDWKLLKKEFSICVPKGLTKAEMRDVHLGGHAFLHFEGRWYDAECPEGAESFLDLPIFRRPIVSALRRKGIPTDDVHTDDVVTPPACKVENPTRQQKLVAADTPSP